MKKELLIASLMLTSPAVLAHTVDSQNQPVQNQEITKAQWVFEADDYIRMPRYDYNRESGSSTFSHFEVIKASVHFYPVDSTSDLFDFILDGFNPIEEGDEEFEVAFKTQSLTNDNSYFEGDNTYYGVKKGDSVYLFDCDSTRRCHGEKGSDLFAVMKIKKDGSMTFVHTAARFTTPYIEYNYESNVQTDHGAKLSYALKK